MIQANDFISKLRLEPDSVLKQMADMHQNDPYLFPMIFQESQARKDKRAQAQAQQMGQQPLTTKEQDLQQIAALDQSQPQMNQPAPPAGNMPQAPNTPSGMPLQGPGSGAQMLPEEQGIGALPANNLQRMAGGGITGYDEGGTTYSPAVYKRYAMQQAQKLGLPPTFVDGIFTNESHYNPHAKSKTGPIGIGQLAADTAKGYGLDPSERTDGFKNIDASLAFMKDLQGKYKNDPQKMALAYNQGETFANKHLKANNGQVVPDNLNKPEAVNYLKKLNDYLPMSSAHAEVVPGREATAPTQAPVKAVDQIPGQTVKAPASNYEQTNTYFGGLADRLGISPEVQRNISNSLNALGGYSSPISSVGKGVGIASKGLAPTAEMVAKAEQAKNAVALPRLGYSAGIEGLAPEAQAMRDLEIANKQKALLDADRAAALGAEQSVNAATQTSDIARKMEESIANARRVGATAKLPGTEKAITLGGRLNEAKLSGAAQGLAAMNDMEKMGLASTATEPQYPNENGPEDRLNMPAPTPTPATDKTEAVKQTEEPKQGRDWNDMLLNLGLGLMAGQSPYALQNLGTAGLGALKADREQKNQKLQDAYLQAKTLEATNASDLEYQGKLARLRAEPFNPAKAYADVYLPGHERAASVAGSTVGPAMTFPEFARMFPAPTTQPSSNATIYTR